MSYPRMVDRGKRDSAVEESKMTDESPSPAAPLQPVKEAGRGTVLQGDQQSSPSDGDVLLPDAAVREGRGAKRSRPEEALQPSSSSLSPTSASSSSSSRPASVSGSGVTVPAAGVSPPPAAVVPPSLSSNSPAGVGAQPAAKESVSTPATTQKNWVPLRVSHDKLQQQSIDDARTDAIVVKFLSDVRLPSPLLVDPAQYRGNPTAKLRAAASLLGSPNGFGIRPPAVPRFLFSPSMMSDVESCTSAQQEWTGTLQMLMGKHAALVIREEQKSDSAVLANALQDLLQHLGMVGQLWSKDKLTSGWADLLVPPSRIVEGPASAQPQSGVSYYLYQVEVHAPTPELTYIIACILRTYGRLREIAPAVTQGVTTILDESTGLGGASSTDSSDEDANGFTQKHVRRGGGKYHARKREAAMLAKLNKFLDGPTVTQAVPHDEGDGVSGLSFYKAFTSDPLRSLGTKVRIRPVYIPYVSFIIERLDTVGCNVYDDLSQDPVYQQIISCIPEFQNHNAHWSVIRRVGGSGASVWIREQHMDKIVQLNDYLRTVMGIRTAALHIRHMVAPRRPGGRVDYKNAVNISLTPPSPSVPSLPRVPTPGCVTTVHSPSGLSGLPGVVSTPYAACVLEGLKRSAVSQSASVDHRPHKGQRTTASASAAQANVKTSAQPASQGGQVNQSKAMPSGSAHNSMGQGQLSNSALSAKDTALHVELNKCKADLQRMQNELSQMRATNAQSPVPDGQPMTMASMQTSMQAFFQQQMCILQQQQQEFIQQQQHQWMQYQQQQRQWQQQQMQQLQQFVVMSLGQTSSPSHVPPPNAVSNPSLLSFSLPQGLSQQRPPIPHPDRLQQMQQSEHSLTSSGPQQTVTSTVDAWSPPASTASAFSNSTSSSSSCTPPLPHASAAPASNGAARLHG
jgi:hypothetical protein